MLGTDLVEDSIHALQTSIAEHVECHVSTRLDTSIRHAIACVCKGDVFLVHSQECVSDGELDSWQLVRGCRGWEKVSTLVGIISGVWNCVVDCLAGIVVDQSKSCASVNDGSVASKSEILAVDPGGRRFDRPEPLAAWKNPSQYTSLLLNTLKTAGYAPCRSNLLSTGV